MAARRQSLLLVVDASVARSAGETEHPVSSACRRYLTDILEVCHRVAVTDDLRDEWDRHRSRFTRKWAVHMAARQKPLQRVSPQKIAPDLSGVPASTRDLIEKDWPLVEAAMAADRVIVTRDTTFIEAMRRSEPTAKLARRLTWHNPSVDAVASLPRR